MKKKDPSAYLVKGTEWFARLAVLNFTCLLFSLPVVTLFPALNALFAVLKRWTDEEEKVPAFHTFVVEFKKGFVPTFKTFSLHMIIGFILIFNLFFFKQSLGTGSFFSITKYANYFLTILYIVLFVNSLALFQRVEYTKVSRLAAGAFVVALSQPAVTLAWIAGTLLLYVVFLFMPALIFFFSLSVPALAATFSVKKGYQDLIKKSQTSKPMKAR